MRSLLAAGAVSALVFVSGVQAQDAAYDASTVLARVNGTEITLGHVIVLRSSLPEQYQQLPDEMLLPGLLEQLVDQALLAVVKSPGAETDPLGVRLHLENERRGALAALAVQEQFGTPLDEATVEAAYAKSIEGFEPAREFNASHILVAEEAEATALKAEIDGGADFAALATEHSLDPGSGANGGSLGWFGLGRMVPEFETAVTTMTDGEVAGPIQTQFGWHLIRLNESRFTSPPPLAEVRGEIEGQLFQEALQARIAEMRAGAAIEMTEPGVPPAAIRETELVTN
jgi:peptidyl-prolyl cis-trans isomerase C